MIVHALDERMIRPTHCDGSIVDGDKSATVRAGEKAQGQTPNRYDDVCCLLSVGISAEREK